MILFLIKMRIITYPASKMQSVNENSAAEDMKVDLVSDDDLVSEEPTEYSIQLKFDDEEDEEEDEKLSGIQSLREHVHRAMAAKHNICSMQLNLIHPIINDTLAEYDTYLCGEIKALSAKHKVNFKFVIKDALPIKNQLSEWVLLNEFKVSEKHPYPQSFIVFMSLDIWVAMQNVNAISRKSKGFFWREYPRLNNDSYGLFMLLIEYYIAAFVTVCMFGHSSLTTEDLFLNKMKEVYTYRFGEASSVWTPHQWGKTNPEYIYNRASKEVGQFLDIIDKKVLDKKVLDKKVIVWPLGVIKEDEDPLALWDRKDTLPIKIEFYQDTPYRFNPAPRRPIKKISLPPMEVKESPEGSPKKEADSSNIDDLLEQLNSIKIK